MICPETKERQSSTALRRSAIQMTASCAAVHLVPLAELHDAGQIQSGEWAAAAASRRAVTGDGSQRGWQLFTNRSRRRRVGFPQSAATYVAVHAGGDRAHGLNRVNSLQDRARKVRLCTVAERWMHARGCPLPTAHCTDGLSSALRFIRFDTS